MAGLVKGDVVVVPFPFSDLTHSKRRPALVLTSLQGNDLILCQITSKTIKDCYAVSIQENDFHFGSLHQESNARPNRLFTADEHIILYRIGSLKKTKIDKIIYAVTEIIKSYTQRQK